MTPDFGPDLPTARELLAGLVTWRSKLGCAGWKPVGLRHRLAKLESAEPEAERPRSKRWRLSWPALRLNRRRASLRFGLSVIRCFPWWCEEQSKDLALLRRDLDTLRDQKTKRMEEHVEYGISFEQV